MDSTSDPKENIDFFPPQIYKLCLVLSTAISITFWKRALSRTALNEQISLYQVNMQWGNPPLKQHWPPRRRSSISHRAGSWHLQIIFFNYFAALNSNCQHFLCSLLEDASWPHSQSHHREMSRRFHPALLWKCDFHVTSQTANEPRRAGQSFSQGWPFQAPDLSWKVLPEFCKLEKSMEKQQKETESPKIQEIKFPRLHIDKYT